MVNTVLVLQGGEAGNGAVAEHWGHAGSSAALVPGPLDLPGSCQSAEEWVQKHGSREIQPEQ